MATYDIVVVGGGISGMTSALLLASSGRRVALVEASPRLAPTICGFQRHGVHFDTGLHYVGGLGVGDPLNIYFRHLKVMESIQPIEYDPTGYDQLVFEDSGQCFSLPVGYEALEQAFALWFPTEEKAINTYFSAVRRIFDSSPFLNFSSPLSDLTSGHAVAESVREYTNHLTQNRQLQVLLEYPCLLYGTSPQEASFTTHALVAGSYYRSVHAIIGGGGAVTQAFQHRLASVGVDVLCGQAVQTIRVTTHGEFAGVILSDKTEVLAAGCIWTAHPKTMVQAAPPHALRGPFRHRIEQLEESPSALILFGLSYSAVPELTRKNLILWPGGDFHEKLMGKAPMKENVLLQFAGQGIGADKTPVTLMAPANDNAFNQWHGSRPGKRPDAYTRTKRQAVEDLQINFQRRCPQVANEIMFFDGATPLTVSHFCRTPAGGIYGARHSLTQFPLSPLTRIRGLLLCGQSIVAPGILGAVVSAYLTCGFILGHQSLHQELREAS